MEDQLSLSLSLSNEKEACSKFLHANYKGENSSIRRVGYSDRCTSRVSFASVAVYSITTFIRVNEETFLAIQTNGPIVVESALINVK